MMGREQQFAEYLANGLTIPEIGAIMGYRNRQSANAQFQRIRAKLGAQAV